MADAHANFARSLVVTAPSPATSGTSLVVQAGDGALFPAVPFNVILFPVGTDPSATTAEIARVTVRSTDTLTITRAQEGTTARTVVAGWQIVAGITAKTLTDAESFQMLGHMGAFNTTALAGTQTFYWGAYASVGVVQTTGWMKIPVVKPGLITRIDVATFVTVASSAQDVTFVLRKNGSDVATLTTTKRYNQGPTTQTIVSYTGLSVAIVAGDYLEFKEVHPSWTTAPTGIYQRAEILVSGS